MTDYTKAETLRAEINRLRAVEKVLYDELRSLPEGSDAAASTDRAVSRIGDQIRGLETELEGLGNDKAKAD